MAGRSAALFRRALRAVPGGVNSPVRRYDPHPFFAARARGGRVWDADGRSYVDLCCGYGALLLGHAHPAVSAAVAAQARRGALYGAPCEAEVELAEAVSRQFPSMRSVRLVNTGAEATMTAIRLARAHTGRRRVLKFDGCYHGAHDSVLVRAGSGASGAPSSPGGIPGAARHTLVARYNDAEGAARAASRHAADLACIIVEPVAANAGLLPPRPGFLRALRRAADASGALLVFDEVVTGFRAGPSGAQGLYGVRPDLTTLGKALGGGVAVSAVGGRRDVMGLLAPAGPVYQASTFAGNPLAAAGALAAVRAMRRAGPAMYRRLESRCSELASAARDAAASAGAALQVNSVASMFQVFFSEEPVWDAGGCARADGARFGRMLRGLLRRGVFAAPSRFETAFLSAAHTREDLAAAAEAYAAAVAGAARG